MKNKYPEFDHRKVFDEQVQPLLQQAFAICKQHNMQIVMSACTYSDQQGVIYKGSAMADPALVPPPFYIAARIVTDDDYAQAVAKVAHIIEVVATTGAAVEEVAPATLSPSGGTLH